MESCQKREGKGEGKQIKRPRKGQKQRTRCEDSKICNSIGR